VGLQEQVLRSISLDTIDTISQKVGIESGTIDKIIQAGTPLIIGQLGKNTSSKEGATALEDTLGKHHDGSLLDNLSSIFSGENNNTDGIKILDHILGNDNSALDKLSSKFNLPTESIQTVLSFLTPLIMAQLGKQRIQKSLSADGLSQLLGSQKNKQGNSLTSIATSFFDKNNDGSVLDDVMNMFKK
jgi:hypothetical protein